MKLLILATSACLALTGCTLISAGAAAGGAALSNQGLADGSSDHTSVGKAALVGAAVGLLIDIIVTKEFLDGLQSWHID